MPKTSQTNPAAPSARREPPSRSGAPGWPTLLLLLLTVAATASGGSAIALVSATSVMCCSGELWAARGALPGEGDRVGLSDQPGHIARLHAPARSRSFEQGPRRHDAFAPWRFDLPPPAIA